MNHRILNNIGVGLTAGAVVSTGVALYLEGTYSAANTFGVRTGRRCMLLASVPQTERSTLAQC